MLIYFRMIPVSGILEKVKKMSNIVWFYIVSLQRTLLNTFGVIKSINAFWYIQKYGWVFVKDWQRIAI